LNSVFIAGSTGYLGTRLADRLLQKGYRVQALVRKGSEKKVPAGCLVVEGNALDANSYRSSIESETFVHLIGVNHPSPSKAELFRSIDLPAATASIDAAIAANIKHFVYVSVAHPAPVMKAYVQTRIEAEEKLRASGLNATILRPWYVLGPGHRWAYVLIPFYKIFEMFPATREGAIRCGLVTLNQMLAALMNAVENPVTGIRVLAVPEIRKLLNGVATQAG
jgi:uncharacterized protein YbjT (DUF2867 family)